ncbi:GntR family transcriptional regulator [Salinibacterium sp.]|uniref:GntR family transcriptional regulator n=1 Tax=Salinibacterium sp. TaxID=1915057 RepID=UPI00286D5805|nr:GntR family transcriptional regulator [Salinibacterium sp.]
MVPDSDGRPSTLPRRTVLADGTYDLIKAMILEHDIAPGEHLGIDELARDLSVSQTPVRESLARLEADGLVTKIPLRGYETTRLLSVQQFDDLFQFRGVIEPWAAAEASRRSTRREIEALEAELERAEHISRTGTSSTYTEFVEHDTRFHTLVARASGNPLVEEAFIRTRCHMHLFRVHKASFSNAESGSGEGEFVQDMFQEYYRDGERPLALNEHIEITVAIRGGDGNSASELMRSHIDSSRRRFIPAIEALHA